MWRKAILFYSDKVIPQISTYLILQMSTYQYICICRKITLPMKCFIISHIKRDVATWSLLSRGQNTLFLRKDGKHNMVKQISFN